MNEIEVLLRDGTTQKFHASIVTTHDHVGVCPCDESLRKVIGNRNGYLAVVEKSGYPRSNMIQRILSEEILDIRKDGQTIMYIPPQRDYEF